MKEGKTQKERKGEGGGRKEGREGGGKDKGSHEGRRKCLPALPLELQIHL